MKKISEDKNKDIRQGLILSIIKNNQITTQRKLVEMLNKQGISVSQSSISRDIEELNITKISRDKKRIYAVDNSENVSTHNSFKQLLGSGVTSIEHSENIIVMKTVAGMAMAVGAAIDDLNIDGIMGCIAGDDTLFLAIKSRDMAREIIVKIKEAANK